MSEVWTCETSRFDSNSNRTSRFLLNSEWACAADSKFSNRHVTSESNSNLDIRFEFEFAHSLFNKNINLCAVCSWDLCLQLHFTCSCTAVARAHTQLPHDNRHWTCKRLPPDSIRDSILIRNERKFPIPRSLVWSVITTHKHTTAKRDLINVISQYKTKCHKLQLMKKKTLPICSKETLFQ